MATDEASNEAVLLLHGAWMNRWVMSYLALGLKRNGFAVQTLTYRTRGEEFDVHLSRVQAKIQSIEADRVHLVGHSLGGLIVLRYLQRRPHAQIGRVVLLAAPVAGCRAASRLSSKPVGALLMGKSASIWRQPVDTKLDPSIELGCIAGTGKLGLGRLVTRLPVPNDGVVCPEEVRVPGTRDYLELPLGHTVMLFSPIVVRQISAFLKRGAFLR